MLNQSSRSSEIRRCRRKQMAQHYKTINRAKNFRLMAESGSPARFSNSIKQDDCSDEPRLCQGGPEQDGHRNTS